MSHTDQLELFAGARPDPKRVEAAVVEPELERLASELPTTVRLGGSTWSYPGWVGSVYAGTPTEKQLAKNGLGAYAEHPLLTAVGLDRTYYAPLPIDEYERLAAAVPPSFRFLVKAHEALTLETFPDRPRYGSERGKPNPRFLDPSYASEKMIAPVVEGLGERLGAVLFQFTGQPLGPADRFAERLRAFLSALPRGPLYAIELRNRHLLGAAYRSALMDCGACHCLNVHPAMPEIATQAALTGADRGPALILRWIVRPGSSYAAARERFAPYDRLVEPAPGIRGQLAALAAQTAARDRMSLITVNNLAEGSAPLSIALLARAIAEASA